MDTLAASDPAAVLAPQRYVRPQMKASGKPAITAKKPFNVKHLHHKSRLRGGIDR
jgi:hypothetical protein